MTATPPRTCLASVDAPTDAPALIRAWRRLVGGEPSPRCGAPATHETTLGPRCAACLDRFRQAMRDPQVLVNVIGGRARTEEEIARMIRPIGEATKGKP